MNALDFCFSILAQVATEPQISLLTASHVAKSQRQERYNFALIEKRFEVNQECYELAEEMAVVYCNEDKKSDVLKAAKKWLHQNSLYLNPSVREKFKSVMRDVGYYDIKKTHALDAGQVKDKNPEAAVEANKALKIAFDSIKDDIKAELESEVDGNFWKRMK